MRMNLLCRGVDPDHGFSRLVIDLVFDRHHAEIGILAVKASFGRLIGMHEPMIAHHGWVAQSSRDIALKALGAFGLAGYPRPGPLVFGRPESSPWKENSEIRHGFLPAA